MGTIDRAFNFIENKELIHELSVVLYADSFFYGLWDTDNQLVKAGLHPHESFESTIQLAAYHHNIRTTKVISTLKPYVHLPYGEFEEEHYELYFNGLYNLERLDGHEKLKETFAHEDIHTLHYILEDARVILAKYDLVAKVSHISTATANYGFGHDKRLICFTENQKLHITALNEKGFLFYNQFDCYYPHDHLYFIMLVIDTFFAGDRNTQVNLCGQLDLDIIKCLRSYFNNYRLIANELKLNAQVKLPQPYFFDLHLCRTCVS